jgi:hypothetical protein
LFLRLTSKNSSRLLHSMRKLKASFSRTPTRLCPDKNRSPPVHVFVNRSFVQRYKTFRGVISALTLKSWLATLSSSSTHRVGGYDKTFLSLDIYSKFRSHYKRNVCSSLICYISRMFTGKARPYLNGAPFRCSTLR